jgi:hypothetical protein
MILAALSNPNESSFRSHLTEQSFRRHLVDIRTSDSLHPSSDHAEIETAPATVTSSSGSGSTSAPTPFRFANHVSINLRTPPLLYRSHLFFSTGVATPLASPCFLAMSDPLSVLKRGREREKDRSTVFIGFFGHWSPVTINLVSELIVAILGDGREKGKRRERPGIIDVKALSSKEDNLPGRSCDMSRGHQLNAVAKPLALAPKMLKPDTSSEPLAPPIPSPSLSRRPSLVAQASTDAPDSPLVASLKADLSSAQTTLNDLKSQLQLHESSADSTLTLSLDELRTRRKEDDSERQELKSKTKSLEEQKRQAESGRREAEKKLKAVEALRDGLETKIKAARDGAVETKNNMDQSERNVRSIQEDGARHVVETLDNVEARKQEMGRLETELVDLENKNEELGTQVKEAEDRLKVAAESGARASPEEEMMMMAAAYEAAAQEGYHHQSQNQWAHQAAAYMAEAGMPYLGQDYTARPTRTTSANHQSDFGRFDDFGPGARDLHQPSAQQSHILDISHGRPHTAPEPEQEEEVEIGPGSPNGTSFLPQGLFRSLEGDATPVDSDAHDSGSDSGDELWKSPVPEPAHLPQPQPHQPPVTHGRFMPSSTTPPAINVNPLAAAAPTPIPALNGLSALPGSRRWLSGTSSNENVALSFLHTGRTAASTDSLQFDSSPFAPSASEKQALKWGPLSRWARGNESAPGPSARSSSVDLGLGNGIVAAPNSNSTISTTSSGTVTGGTTRNWLSSRFGTSPSALADAPVHALSKTITSSSSGSGYRNGDDHEEVMDEAEKKPFRFFSLKKTPSTTS